MSTVERHFAVRYDGQTVHARVAAVLLVEVVVFVDVVVEKEFELFIWLVLAVFFCLQ